jgi:hypothetical protein
MAYRSLPILLLLLSLFPGRGPALAQGLVTLEQETYAMLDGARDGKQAQLTAYLTRMEDLARTVSRDTVMQRYFNIKRRFWQLQQVEPPPPEVRQAIGKLKDGIQKHYLAHYLAFYDILFVDRSGYVLSTMRRQGEYHRNLFEGELASTALSARLRAQPGEAFVDYEFYWVSDEPSAFYVEPLVQQGEQLGWFVCQCAINKINGIFSRSPGLGATGETFLVNRQHRMMTESRLRPEGGGLQRSLARENIEPKFAQGTGHRRVTDYRGYPALTSFTVCRVQDSEWLVVAKIDEDEVITRHYRDRLPGSTFPLGPAAATQPVSYCQEQALPGGGLMVDMDEYRVSAGDPLMTVGVATCTAILITLPGGQAYLGHVSENDRLYGGGDMDLLGNMLWRIRRFEIKPYQLRDVQVVLAAPHTASLDRALDILLEEGLFLSQITFLHAPAAASASLVHYPESRRTVVRWMGPEANEARWQCADQVQSLGLAYRSHLESH